MRSTWVLSIALLLLASVAAAGAAGQTGYRLDKLTESTGQTVAGASIAVCTRPANIIAEPCAPTATLYPDSNGANYAISSIACSAGTVIVTTSAAHDVPKNQWVTIAGVADASFDGTFQVTESRAPGNTLTYTNPCTDGTSSGGTVTGANPTYSDGLGHYFYYAAKGTYTVEIYSPKSSEIYTVDQQVASPSVLTSTNIWTGAQTFKGNMTATEGQNALTAYSIDDILMVDGNKYTTCADAIAAAASRATLVVQPSNYTGAPCPKIPNNVTVLDLTRNATLTLNTNPTRNAAGQSVGMEINVGSVPPNPGPNNFVVFVPQISCINGIPCWDENPVAYLPPLQPDTYVRGVEYDIDIGYIPGKQPRGTAQYIGGDAVCGWNYPCTFGWRTNTVPGEASWQYAFNCEMATYNCYYIYPNVNTYIITQPVNAGNQSVSTNVVAFRDPVFIQQWISVDAGPNHEDVQITSVTKPNLIGGLFRKKHAKYTTFFTYTTDQFWNPSNSVAREYAYLLGDISEYNQINATNPLGWSVINNIKQTIPYDYFDRSNIRHFRDAGGAGWVFEGESGARQATISSTGTIQGNKFSLTHMASSDVAPAVSSGFGLATSIGAANGTASFTIDVGTGPTMSAVTLAMPNADTGWNCMATDKTNPGTNLVRQSGGSSGQVILTNYNVSGAATIPPANDIIGVLCGAY